MTEPAKPYDDKAAEGSLGHARAQLRALACPVDYQRYLNLTPDALQFVCDHLDSARAEIARLKADLGTEASGRRAAERTEATQLAEIERLRKLCGEAAEKIYVLSDSEDTLVERLRKASQP